MELNTFMEDVIRMNPGQPEFHQAVSEFAINLIPFINGEFNEYPHEKL